mmetsp:Transcript_21533/g.27394  ORF Transcript_21533/g.27394 Transcript_21533/m.27394 type:complete len:93 (-) Transcript_21533:37-315(-)
MKIMEGELEVVVLFLRTHLYLDFFSYQNDLLTELGCIIQKRMEASNMDLQQRLTELYQQVQQNATLTKKLRRIHIQTNSLHEAVVGPQSEHA